MDLLLSWVAFPVAFGLLCGGCGLAAERMIGVRAPGALLPGLGFAAIVVVGQFLTLAAWTVPATTPAVVALAVIGLVVGRHDRRPVRPSLLIASAMIVFATYAAPIVLSGDATLAGFIKLDDTATWLAFTDQVMASGRELDGLAPSTYEATLRLNVGDGYPLGAFIPLGVGAELVGTDPAWLVQPYMATLAALLALALWPLAAPLISSPRARAAVVAVAAQPALLFGYYLWGGVKEVAAAALIATAAGLAAHAVAAPREARRLIGLGVACAATIGVLSGGGAVWLAPILVVAVPALAARLSLRALAARALALSAGIAILALPVIVPGGLLPPTSSPLGDDDAQGNLIEPLDHLQVAGIWPAGDFRLAPDAEPVVYAVSAAALGLAAIGIACAWRRRATGALAWFAGGTAGCLLLVTFGSPWVDGKALATASPVVLFGALAGAVAVGRWPGLVAGLVIAGGVVWSNALAYRDVSLAPREQLAELEAIGEEIAGEGPTLMTEYSPYGARHFLREADPESVSELRRRSIPLANGEVVPKGEAADTDELDPAALGVYRTLVLRRSPAQSRPPGAYELVWRGEHYEAWQRPSSAGSLPERLPLGTRFDPVEQPRCADVAQLARGAGELRAARSVSPRVVRFARTPPPGAEAVAADVRLTTGGEHEVWVGGSVRSRLELTVDGEPAGEVRHVLNNAEQYVRLGATDLGPGLHRVELRYGGADLHPGSGGGEPPVGPLALTRAEAADSILISVPAADATRLCGRAWDWIEAGG